MFYAFLPLPGGAVGVVFAFLALAACVYCPPIGIGVLIAILCYMFPLYIGLSILFIVETMLVWILLVYFFFKNIEDMVDMILFAALLPLSGWLVSLFMNRTFFNPVALGLMSDAVKAQKAVDVLVVAFPAFVYIVFALYVLGKVIKDDRQDKAFLAKAAEEPAFLKRHDRLAKWGIVAEPTKKDWEELEAKEKRLAEINKKIEKMGIKPQIYESKEKVGVEQNDPRPKSLPPIEPQTNGLIDGHVPD